MTNSVLEETIQLSPSLLLASESICECFHDYAKGVEHYLSLATVNVLAGDVAPQNNDDNPAEACFKRATWIVTIAGDSPDGYVPPSSRLLCDWCKDKWESDTPEAYLFEPLR